MAKKIISQNYCFETETEDFSQTDLVNFAESRLVEDDVYETYNFVEKKVKKVDLTWSDETTPIELSKLKKILKDAEEAGSTHVKVFYHSDHQNYVIHGLSVTKGIK